MRKQGQVAILTIDRPARRNALGTELMRSLDKSLIALERDDAVSAIVISAVPPGVCAGSDLKELAEMDIAQMCDHEAETARIVRAIGFIEKPVVAAVSGFALGGGVGLAVGCDLIVTHPECRWHMPVFDVSADGLVLTEVTKGVDVNATFWSKWNSRRRGSPNLSRPWKHRCSSGESSTAIAAPIAQRKA